MREDAGNSHCDGVCQRERLKPCTEHSLVYRDIEETLYLGSMQIHGLEGMSVQQAYWDIDTHDDVIAARPLEHISHQFRCDRGATLVLLVLSGVREEGEDGGDALRAGNLAGMDHNTHFHERGVDGAAASIDDVDIVFTHGLANVHFGFADAAACDLCCREGQTKANVTSSARCVDTTSIDAPSCNDSC